MKALKPPPRLTVSEWADRYRKLSPESSAEIGQWQTSRAEYQRGIMDAVNDPTVESVVVMSSAQVGKTEIINNIIGYFIDQDPSPILILQPTLQMAESWSKDRLAPMLRDTPRLKGKVKDPQSRNSGNTILHKVFPGGHITMAGANSPASLASRPIRIVCGDEVDRYPISAGAEGDPISLAKKRTTTFWNRKEILTSTPTIKGASRIEHAYDNSDKRRYFVPCPDCGEFQYLKWENIKWPDGEPEKAKYICEHCGVAHGERSKKWMIRHGEWRATAPFNGVAGFHLSELYSPWVAWADMVAHFLEAKKLPETLKTWVNTSLGQTWESKGETVDPDGLMVRREDYGDTIPAKACVLTAGVDVQNDRLECEIVAWGIGQESWSIDYKVFYGNPGQEELWSTLDNYLLSTWDHASGTTLRVSATCIDSGGSYTDQVYKFVKTRKIRRVWAIKGKSKAGAPIASKPSENNKYRIKLFLLGTDTAKELIYSRLDIKEPGPGFCHFSLKNDKTYFDQLTAEEVVTRYVKGHAQRIWVKKERARNEVLDCRVYALAAVEIINPNFASILASLTGSQSLPAPQTKRRVRSKGIQL